MIVEGLRYDGQMFRFHVEVPCKRCTTVAVLEVILHNIPHIQVEENYNNPAAALLYARTPEGTVVAAYQHWCWPMEPPPLDPDFAAWEQEILES